MWISEMGKTVVAHAAANLTFSNRRELVQLALDACERGARNVIVDLGATGHVDTAALGALAMLASRVRLRGGEFCLTNVNEEVKAVLALTKLETVIPIRPTEPGRAD